MEAPSVPSSRRNGFLDETRSPRVEWHLVAFGASVAGALGFGLLALYARDVRRDPVATRRLALLGALATLASMALGWWAF